MPSHTWLLLFVPACFALNMAPGPNNVLSMTNAVNHGVVAATLAGLGRLVAFVILIAITAVGLGALLAASDWAFWIMKWVGAAYLIYLGVRLFRAGAPDMAAGEGRSASLGKLQAQEFWVALSNPKAILIFTAFFPQFLTGGSFALEIAIMGGLFLVLELVAIIAYALFGHSLRSVVAGTKGLVLLHRISGSALVGAGVLLALSNRK